MSDQPHPEGKSRRKAVALRYESGRDDAPRLVGKGAGELAERIIALAREHNVPIQEHPDLVEILSRLNPYSEIPPSTYVLVAEILAFVYRTNESCRRT